MSGNKKVAFRSVHKLKEHLDKILEQPTSKESLSTFGSHLKTLSFLVDTVESIAASTIDKIDPLNKTPEAIAAEEDKILDEIAFVREYFTYYSGKFAYLQSKLQMPETARSNTSSLHLDQSLVAPSTPRLPKISIPEFSGDIRNFLSWKNLFTNLIQNNPDLSNCII